jgi:hypothetical protein
MESITLVEPRRAILRLRNCLVPTGLPASGSRKFASISGRTANHQTFIPSPPCPSRRFPEAGSREPEAAPWRSPDVCQVDKRGSRRIAEAKAPLGPEGCARALEEMAQPFRDCATRGANDLWPHNSFPSEEQTTVGPHSSVTPEEQATAGECRTVPSHHLDSR